jgi:hypothetical protein
MTWRPGKLRTRGHVLSDLSINCVERQVLLSGSCVQRLHSDYGYDLVMSSFNTNGEIEPGILYFQVKATDDLPVLAEGKTISWVVSRRDLRLWLAETFPVILVVYDGKRDRAYWLDVQAYFGAKPTAELFLAGETINVHVPIANRLNRRSLTRMIDRKNAAQARLRRRDHSHG